ncbi:shikimate dehydrogenase [Microbacterium protaetiae]|uniref:Shikimate dehydrogenase n=1 Tax=Microbacterium protaetiae TaxID=2509458 RepID=A0A4P6EN31_9MICO|nr:shikimate dehydrogenase [Microbacterium protaetiae]QAY59298.1 shikimate dehydrogenase [Microbacterium protaetiae]
MTQAQASARDDRFLVGLIGRGIGPSLSPPLHTAEATALGLDYRYVLHDLAELDLPPESVGDILDRLRDAGYSAVNITYPCKQLVMAHLDEIDRDAARLGAVNLVVIRDGRFVGYNTDWVGFRDGVRNGLPGASLNDVVQFGGGGAGSASAYALLSLGTKRLTVADIEPLRVEDLCARLRAAFPEAHVASASTAEAGEALARADGAVNATPLGMAEHPGVAFDVAALKDSAWVADVVYFPIDTELLQAARRRGLETLDGGRMNVGQAVEGIRLITGVRPDAERMRAHFLELIDSRRGTPVG